jgi:uncharacterized protein (TIGR02757 family)
VLSPERAARLRPLLEGFRDTRAFALRVAADPIEFPQRYRDPRDVEVVALLSAALAYGRVDLFKPKIAGLLANLGPRPAQAVHALTVSQAHELLDGFVYRFNVPADLAVLLLGMGRTLEADGSLEQAFVNALAQGGTWRLAIAGFIRRLRALAPEREIVRVLGKTRGVHHLLPGADSGAAKRLNLYLRWMVRGPDAVDRGVWRQLSPAQLIIPVDTHVARMGWWLGLTERKTISWAMAEEITASLRLLDADDPVKYDFVLCHYGMSGACPATPVRANCVVCPLKSSCKRGRELR